MSCDRFELIMKFVYWIDYEILLFQCTVQLMKIVIPSTECDHWLVHYVRDVKPSTIQDKILVFMSRLSCSKLDCILNNPFVPKEQALE